MAVRQIGPQQRLDAGGTILRSNALPQLAADPGVLGEPAADDDVVALDRVAVVADRYLRTDQADVADVVLGAGMMAAGQVDVDRHVEREPRRFDVIGDPERILFGVGRRELAPRRAGAGDEPGADARGLGRQPERRDARLDVRDARVRHAREEEILPDGQAEVAVAALARDRRDLAHLLGRELADRQHDADPVQPRLLLRVHAQMREAVGRGARRDVAGGDARERASFSPTAVRNLSKPQESSTYFSRALLRLVRSPFAMKTRTIASATATQSFGAHTIPVSRAMSRWPVMPPSTTRIQTPCSMLAPSRTSTA